MIIEIDVVFNDKVARADSVIITHLVKNRIHIRIK